MSPEGLTAFLLETEVLAKYPKNDKRQFRHLSSVEPSACADARFL